MITNRANNMVEFLPEVKQKNQKIITSLVQNVLYNSFSQAIIRIIITPYLMLKLFLITCVLCSSGLASYLVIKSIMSYLSYEVSTISRTIYETPTLFPKVTFCNVNWFTTEYAYNLTQKGVDWDEVFNFTIDEKQKLGHDLEDILIECKFNLHKCNSSDFSWSFDEEYGNCFTFNANASRNSLKESKIAGLEFGLQLKMYVNIYEKFLNDTSNVYGLGALIRIGNSSYSSDYLNGGIFLPSGFHTNIVVEREFKSMLPQPYSCCDLKTNWQKTDLLRLIEKTDYAYSQRLCFSQCLQKKFIDLHNCTLFQLLSLYNVSQCKSKFYFTTLNTDDTFSGDYISKTCLPQCPLECDQILYKYSTTSYQLIGNLFLENITNNLNLSLDFINRAIDSSTARDSIVEVNIYYESLSYTFSSEIPQMDLVSMLASIGGNLGLFMGMSVFSLFEMIEVVIELFYMTKK
jgi:hypothetical protein